MLYTAYISNIYANINLTNFNVLLFIGVKRLDSSICFVCISCYNPCMDFMIKMAIEMSILMGLGLLYYLYQKSKIPKYIFHERNNMIEELILLCEEELDDKDLKDSQIKIIHKLIDQLEKSRGSGRFGIGRSFYNELLSILDSKQNIYQYLSPLEAEINEEEQLHN